MVNFRKLLPALMRNTKWGDLAVVVQNLTTSLRTDVYNHIYDRFTKDKATAEELISTGEMLGWSILSFPNTYTATLEYLKREVDTIAKRITCKNSKKAYQYTSYIYGMYDEVYPMMYNSVGQLAGKLNTLYDPDVQLNYAVIITDQEGNNLYYNAPVSEWYLDGTKFSLDTGLNLDYTFEIWGDPKETGLEEAFTDTEATPETDATVLSNNTGQIVTNVTRNVLYSYHHKYLETEDEWLSTYSLKSLQNDINQICKATERVYYEPWLKIETDSVSGVTNTQTYFNYDRSVSGVISSILTGDSLLDAQFIQFGTGSHYSQASGIPSNITGVANFSYCIPSGVVSGVTYCDLPSGVGGWALYDTPTSTHIDFDFILSEFNKFTEFTELALLDSSSGLICYSAFPKVQWTSSMYNNIRVQVNLV